ncbi:MAG: type II toxin-antitoxin system VapC family toxin [Gammaproteobacteria bacterium]|nr:type II toxin-antitoxin system VapC family toxin [Gammaproteobacteria bacterium]
MIFVDTNVFMYAVGRQHPLKKQARAFFKKHRTQPTISLVTSAEVMQELMHAYLTVGRLEKLDQALELIDRTTKEVWPVEKDDVSLARALATKLKHMSARDLVHLACCQRRHVGKIKTFDRALAASKDLVQIDKLDA